MKNSTVRRNMLMFTLGGGLLAYGIHRLFVPDRPTDQQLLNKQLQETFQGRFLIAPKQAERIDREETRRILGQVREKIEAYNQEVLEYNRSRRYDLVGGNPKEYIDKDQIIEDYKKRIADYNKSVDEYNRFNQY